MANIMITGIGSGLGKALTQFYLERGNRVLALGHHRPGELSRHAGLDFLYCDLHRLERIETTVKELVSTTERLDLVILNAGILWQIQDMADTPLHEIESVMCINVWANKVLLDALIASRIPVEQIVGISSGAAINCNRGWNAYSLSKAALNTLLKLYAREMEGTHITALAPGIIWTPMLEKVIDETDKIKFPSIQRIEEATKMSPEEAARLLDATFPKLKQYESGVFLDVRNL